MTLALVWRPVKGVGDIKPNLFIFQFYHERDIEKVVKGGPWTFNRNLFLVN